MANIEQRYVGMKMEEMSRTHQDAVYVCRRLDYQYLWIDALCILQENQSARNEIRRREWEDKVRELMKMGDYYQNATFTIAASGATDCNGGLFFQYGRCGVAVDIPYFDTHGSQKGKLTVRSGVPASHDCVLSPDPEAEEAVVSRLWWNRGWTLQERLLSRRMVHFTRDRIFFECNMPQTVAEGGESVDRWQESRSAYLSLSPRDRRLEYLDWYQVVEIFTTCYLGHERDRELAIDGIVQELEALGDHLREMGEDENTFNKYSFGIWLEDIAGLLWRCTAKKVKRNQGVPRAPSWSWFRFSSKGQTLIKWADSMQRLRNNLYHIVLEDSAEPQSSTLPLCGFFGEVHLMRQNLPQK